MLTWTGLGFLTYLLSFVIVVAGVYAGLYGGGTLGGSGGGFSAELLVIAGLSVLLAPLHWLLGWVLNSKRTPSGRQWHDRHTFSYTPMQYGFVPQLGIALIFGSVALGYLTSPLYGWLLCSGVPAVALVGYGLLDKGSFLDDVGCLVVICASVALILGSIALGQRTSPLYGWLLFGSVSVVAGVGTYLGSRVAKRRSAARLRGTAGAARKRE